jgi:two-component system response regulator AdeR
MPIAGGPAGAAPGPLVLIVEDEPRIAEVLDAYLRREGYAVAVAADGSTAVQLHARLSPALVLLDVNLPGLDGFEVLRRIGVIGTPVIMLTAREEEVDKLVALRMGADDYVVKPYSPVEVVARVGAVLRRATAAEGAPASGPRWVRHQDGDSAEVLEAGGVHVDVAGTTARVGGKPLQLTATEYRLLEHLARAPRRTFSRRQLLDAVVPESAAMDRVVDAHLGNLRRKLAAAGAPGLVNTVRGLGYRLLPEG